MRCRADTMRFSSGFLKLLRSVKDRKTKNMLEDAYEYGYEAGLRAGTLYFT